MARLEQPAAFPLSPLLPHSNATTTTCLGLQAQLLQGRRQQLRLPELPQRLIAPPRAEVEADARGRAAGAACVLIEMVFV